MIYKKVKEIPAKTKNSELRLDLEEFVLSNTKYAKLDLKFGEGKDYKTPNIAYRTITVSAKRAGLPIKAYVRNGIVYLENTSM